MRTLGIIPARGGSKGVPRKNVRLLAGDPVIAYTIRAAQESLRLTTFITTTDDDEISDIARRYGSPVLSRPPELALDDTPMAPVLLHALENIEKNTGKLFDAIVLLQPSSPIRTGADIDAVIQMLEEDLSVHSIISVIPMDDVHPARMYRLEKDNLLVPLDSRWETVQRQKLPTVYYRNGALYACRRQLLVEHHMICGQRKKAYIMSREQSVNIDDEVDLLLADILVRRWRGLK